MRIPPLLSALSLLIVPVTSSADLEASWSWSYPGLAGSSVTDLAFDGASGIWAASGSRLLHSGDDGSSWQLLHVFEDDLRMGSLLRLSGGDLLVALTDGSLRRSSDGGAWSVDPTVVAAKHIFEISPGVISVGAGPPTPGGPHGGLWRSVDDGSTWTFTEWATTYDQHWYDASTGIVVDGAAVYRTVDAGATWEIVASPAHRIDASGSDAIVIHSEGTIHVSADAGQTWDVVGVYVETPEWATPTCLALGGGRFFVGSRKWEWECGYTETTDYFATYAFHEAPFPRVMASSGGALYFGCLAAGVLRSVDDGATWTEIVGSGGRPSRGSVPLEVALFSMMPPFGLAGTADTSLVLRTTDGGDSWQGLSSPVGEVRGLGVRDAAIGFIGGDGAVARTLDAGANWTVESAVPGSDYRVVDFEFPEGDHVFALTDGDPNTVVHSDATTNTWSRRDGGLPMDHHWVEIEFPTPLVGYVCAGSQVWATTDGGVSWSFRGSSPIGGVENRFQAMGPDVLFTLDPYSVESPPGGLFRSDDGGTTWTWAAPRAGNGLRERDGVLYWWEEFAGRGFVYSEDGGVNSGVFLHHIERLCCSRWHPLPPEPDFGFIGLEPYPGGVAVLGSYNAIELADLSIIGVSAASSAPSGLALHVERPVDDRFQLSFTLPHRGWAELDVFDVLGRRVGSIWNGQVTGGETHGVTWEGLDTAGRRVENGVYFIRLRAGEAVVATRVVLVR